MTTTTYHVTAIGYRQGAVRLERHIEAHSAAEAAHLGMWLTETMGISVTSMLVRPRVDHTWGALAVFARDALKHPFFGADIVSTGATVNARHLPIEERDDVMRLVETGEMEGLVGQNQLALLMRVINPFDIEDTLPTLSTLVQIANDEGVEWVIFDPSGPFLEDAITYPD